MIGILIGVWVAVAQLVAAAEIDDRRAEQERRWSREDSWRQELVASADLPGAQLDGLSLESVYAPDVNLVGANLSGTDFSNSTFTNARLDNVDLSGADLRDAFMLRSSLRYSDLTDAALDGAVLDGADLRHATLANLDLSAASIRDADLSGADLSGSTMPRKLQVCFDDNTLWPAGYSPPDPVCDAEEKARRGVVGDRWFVDVEVRDPMADTENDGSLSWAPNVQLEGDELVVLLEFNNAGASSLDDTSVVLEVEGPLTGGSFVPGTVRLVNANYAAPGFAYEDSAIQANGQQVNVNIGNTLPRINSFVTARYRIDRNVACGTQEFTIVGYATPEGFGAVSSQANVTWLGPPCG